MREMNARNTNKQTADREPRANCTNRVVTLASVGVLFSACVAKGGNLIISQPRLELTQVLSEDFPGKGKEEVGK